MGFFSKQIFELVKNTLEERPKRLTQTKRTVENSLVFSYYRNFSILPKFSSTDVNRSGL